MEVRFDRIESLVLQSIRPQFLHQPNSTSFLVLIEQYPRTFFRNDTQCQMELIVAVTAQRMKHISSCALRMDADYRRRILNIAKHKSQSTLLMLSLILTRLIHALKAQQAEVSPACWKADISDLSQCDQCECPCEPSNFWSRNRHLFIGRMT